MSENFVIFDQFLQFSVISSSVFREVSRFSVFYRRGTASRIDGYRLGVFTTYRSGVMRRLVCFRTRKNTHLRVFGRFRMMTTRLLAGVYYGLG